MGDENEPKRLKILVCTGSGCSGENAKKLRKHLQSLVEEQQLECVVKVKKADCLRECKRGPVVEVGPGGRQYTKVDPKEAEELLVRILKEANIEK